jgi:hypothetical protein
MSTENWLTFEKLDSRRSTPNKPSQHFRYRDGEMGNPGTQFIEILRTANLLTSNTITTACKTHDGNIKVVKTSHYILPPFPDILKDTDQAVTGAKYVGNEGKVVNYLIQNLRGSLDHDMRSAQFLFTDVSPLDAMCQSPSVKDLRAKGTTVSPAK